MDRRASLKNRRGYSLADLVVTMLILGILASAAAPRYLDSISRFRVEAAAKRIAAALEFARGRAKISGVSREVDFDVASNSYLMTGIADINHPDLDYSFDTDNSQYPAAIISADFGGVDKVTFDIHGHADNGGSVVVSSGGQQRTITVSDTAGKVTVSP